MSGPERTVRFRFGGRDLTAPRGATVAAALLANGISSWRLTRGEGQPRGLFCGIGHCYECLADVAGTQAVRACQVTVREGDEVSPSRSVGGAPAGRAGAVTEAPETDRTGADVAVVGAGPAGMAAALAAAGAGCSVVLVDTAPQVGGQIYRQDQRLAAGASTLPPVTGGLPPRFRRVASHPAITVAAGTSVWHAQRAGEGFRLHCAGPVTAVIDAAAVVVATGASELVFPVPGWTLPGVVTAGAAQAMIKAQGVLAGRRVLVAGSGPLLLPAAVALARHGARVAGVCEAAVPARLLARAPGLARHPARAAEAAGYAAALARHGIRPMPARAVLACEGERQVERAVVVPVDGAGKAAGRPQAIAVDAVAVSMGFVPVLELARALGCACVAAAGRPAAAVVAVNADQAASVPGVFACGEVTGVGGAHLAEAEGSVAGAAAARHLGRLDEAGYRRRAAGPRRRIRRHRRFAAWLDGTYPLTDSWLDRVRPDTVICRCEDVRWEDLAGAFALGAADLRAVKGLTRAGMGYCQGRVCGPVLQHATARQAGLGADAVGDLHTRHIAVPVTVGRLAAASGPEHPPDGPGQA